MNIEKELLQAHSKKVALEITEYIGNDSKRFSNLMQLFFKGDYRLNQRAAWPLFFCVQNHPELINGYWQKMIELLKSNKHDAVRRNIVRIIQDIEVPEKHSGSIADLCFGFLISPNEPIAVKCFSMQVVYNISKKHPDLQNELKLIIKDLMPYGSAGIKSRGRRILKLIES